MIHDQPLDQCLDALHELLRCKYAIPFPSRHSCGGDYEVQRAALAMVELVSQFAQAVIDLGRAGAHRYVAACACTDKHHRGMASAGSDVSPRDYEGWCLPASLDILELGNPQHPTRGDTNGTLPWTGRPRRELHAGGDLVDREAAEGLSGRDQRPSPGRGDPNDPGSQAPGLRGGASERLAVRDAEPSRGRDRGGGDHGEPRAEE